MELNWQKSDVIPVVDKGSEKQFWVAVEIKGKHLPNDEFVTFLAHYQNRPFDQEAYDKDEHEDDDCLVTLDGEYVSSVGWVSARSHVEFDNYYEPINFNPDYKLVGWAEYEAPDFNPDFLFELT